MSYYVIGVGGTGAKCVESFIHLCAAGLMPDAQPVSCLFVDPDGSNGNLKRTSQLLRNYEQCRLLERGNADLFKSELRTKKPDVWSPFHDRPPRLDQFFNYDVLVETPAAHLFDVLYTPKEKLTSLDFGFRGHPSIGAAVMAATVKLAGEEPWDTIFENINRDVQAGETPKIVLFGSIFGGTGASGVPTISRLLGDQFAAQIKEGKLRLGSVLMLPYFSFDPVKSESLRVDADTFLLSTQAALEYYFRQDELKLYNAVYLLGEDLLTPMRTSSIGGEAQENQPHVQEMHAALGAIHFFEGASSDGYPHTARAMRDQTQWNDLPHGKGSAHLKLKIDQLARFSFSFLTSYHPTLASINTSGGSYQAPWYVDLLHRAGVDLKASMEHEFGHVFAYCRSFLLWLANIEQSRSAANSGRAEGLINFHAFAKWDQDKDGKPIVALKAHNEFERQAYGNLLLPINEDKQHTLGRLWTRMSNTRVEDASATGVGLFIRALYEECSPVITV